ncbi:Asparagine synthetase [glutamine-hydrolyzing] 1 [Vibrio aerogenes CECT 7868]|uniref:asparagine synthase (glutamine-hydrolyzing) n=1 Tax=Vibrio aerogenes CECT 7868 TaxID=1216006 RepID=A0A1M6AQD7_9VIBR|nr:asparagine synthase (glutamine-hydrolyzing) [Vibrio aerogenes]SHI38675.1 Asparagine synthetase [glutamine-hydrolyzing] 1 [Vibrio aerogenes CECT 7868]
MCGIAGYLRLNAASPAVSQAQIQILRESIAARGPDETMECIDEHQGLFFSRLAITGSPGNARQPFQDGKSFLLFNGEIYNYRELAVAELNMPLAADRCDGEVILPLFHRYGMAGTLSRLNGPFALAWFRPDGMMLARDSVGKKPLYYLCQDETLFFSSDITGLMKIKHEIDLDPYAVGDYFIFKSAGVKSSLINGISEVPPGYFLWVNHGRYQPELCRFFAETDVNPDSEITPEELITSLNQSIQLRSVNDKPIASLLSGGLDSSIINYLLQQQEQTFRAYTIGSNDVDDPLDEIPLATEFAEDNRINHQSLLLKTEAVPELLEASVIAMEQPVQDPIIVNSLALARHIGREHRVLLTGDGADELWLGYDRFRTFAECGVEDYLQALSLFRPESLHLPDYHPEHYFGVSPYGRDLASLAELERSIRFKNYHLTRMDRIFMKNGLETRSPFLDTNHIRLCARLSATRKFFQGKGKWALRLAFSGTLGQRICFRKKQPFTFPLHYFRQPEFFDYFTSPLNDRQSIVHDYVDLSELTGKVSRGVGLNESDYHKIWSVKVFELWHRRVYRGCLS